MNELIGERLGVDIGRVIIGSPTDGSGPTIFDEETFLEAQAVDGAFETLKKLVDRFDGAIDLVSKCGPTVQDRSSRWLEHAGFHDATGIGGADRVHFCLTRSEKGLIAARLGLTHFIDDSLEVMAMLPESVKLKILFNPDGAEIERVPDSERHLETVQIAEDWPAVEAILL